MFKKLGFLAVISFLCSHVSASLPEAIRTQIQASTKPGGAGSGLKLSAPALISKFYGARDYVPAWLSDEGPLPEVADLLNALSQADREGLDPESYQLTTIRDLLDVDKAADGALGEESMVTLELLLSNAFLTYGSDLVSGRTNPYDVDDDWFAGRRTGDLPGTLEKAIDSREVRKTLGELLPTHPVYERMRIALARYRQMEKNGGWLVIPEGPVIKKGDRDPRLELLRQRLHFEGDLNQKPNKKPVFDAALEHALARFQSRNGLDPDGVLGKSTVKVLNITVSQRVRGIKLNMERTRWLPSDLGHRYIFVNVPSFTLQVVVDRRDTLHMKVVVGRKMRQTPVFSSTMTQIIFNPPWSVPVTVARLDILDHIREEPDYLASHKFEVYDGYDEGSQLVDATTINWSSVTAQNLHYRFRQKSGPLNALGQIKFMLPNPFDVYLHDTSSRSLFSKTVRDFSSGCIRVEKPVELAAYLLQEDPNWTHEKIEAAINSTHEKTISLENPIPVHLMYWTAWVDEQGKVQFREDIYGRDTALAQAMDRGPL